MPQHNNWNNQFIYLQFEQEKRFAFIDEHSQKEFAKMQREAIERNEGKDEQTLVYEVRLLKFNVACFVIDKTYQC